MTTRAQIFPTTRTIATTAGDVRHLQDPGRLRHLRRHRRRRPFGLTVDLRQSMKASRCSLRADSSRSVAPGAYAFDGACRHA